MVLYFCDLCDINVFIDEIGMKLDFIWAPYVSNLTDLAMGFEVKKSYIL